MPNVLEQLPANAFTLSGKLRGPAVALGRCRHGRGQLMFMHDSELLKALRDRGWPAPNEHEKVVAELASAKTELAALRRAHGELGAKADALEAALGWKPEEKPKPKPKSEKRQP